MNTHFKPTFCLLIYTLSIITSYANFRPPLDNEINALIKEMASNLITKLPEISQSNTLFRVIETPCKTCPYNITKYIANIHGERLIPIPAKFMPPLHYTFYNNRIIFSGWSQTGLITIIADSNTFKVVDIILHFALSDISPIFQSPSGRYLLFKKFSPRSAPSSISSDFIMIYDLEKSPKKNRIYGNFNGNLEVTITNSEVGNFFYPENKSFEFSLESPYFTQINSPKNQIFLYSTQWNTKNNIAVISEKSKSSNYKFIIISETPKGIFIKKIYDLNQGKLYTMDNIEIKHKPNLDFFMKGFEIINNILYIYNGAENALFYSVRFRLDSEY